MVSVSALNDKEVRMSSAFKEVNGAPKGAATSAVVGGLDG